MKYERFSLGRQLQTTSVTERTHSRGFAVPRAPFVLARLAVCIAFICALDTSLRAQSPLPADDGATLPSVFSLVRDLPRDLRRLPSVETAVILGLAGGASWAVWDHDADITRRLSRDLGRTSAFDAGDVVGELAVQGAASLVVFTAGRIAHNPRAAAVGADLVRAQIINAAATHGTKALVDRRRPDGAGGSFPSGHTSSTFATAAVLQRHFGWKAGVPAYGLAVFAGTSRLAANKHFLSDVIFGAAIGTVVGRTVSVGRKRARVIVAPYATTGSLGITVTNGS